MSVPDVCQPIADEVADLIDQRSRLQEVLREAPQRQREEIRRQIRSLTARITARRRDLTNCIGRINGAWQLAGSSQVLAVHAALLKTGRVLYFSGSEHDAGQNAAGQVDHTRIWDPASGAIQTVASPAHDLFCSHHAFLADGGLLTVGGTQEWGGVPAPRDHTEHFRGLRTTTIFRPDTAPGVNPWAAAAPLNTERGRTTGGGAWYPGVVTLADGRVFKMSGHPERDDTRHTTSPSRSSAHRPLRLGPGATRATSRTPRNPIPVCTSSPTDRCSA